MKEFSRDTVSETESFSNTQWLHITALILCFLHVSICLMLHSSGRNKVCLVLFGKASSRSHSVWSFSHDMGEANGGGAAPSSCADTWPFQGFHVKPSSGPFPTWTRRTGGAFASSNQFIETTVSLFVTFGAVSMGGLRHCGAHGRQVLSEWKKLKNGWLKLGMQPVTRHTSSQVPLAVEPALLPPSNTGFQCMRPKALT